MAASIPRAIALLIGGLTSLDSFTELISRDYPVLPSVPVAIGIGFRDGLIALLASLAVADTVS
eukprot:1262742-Amorphochlora_amoeboformis.AAC.1